MTPDLSKSERETLKAIYRHTRPPRADAATGETRDAHTGDLADTLGVSPGTVTATVKRLAERGLVDHRPYHGVRFTPTGQRAAVASIRRHRIVERFLADMLGYAWNEADRLATSFEHDLPDEVGVGPMAPETRFIAKPFSSHSLARTVRDVLSGRAAAPAGRRVPSSGANAGADRA